MRFVKDFEISLLFMDHKSIAQGSDDWSSYRFNWFKKHLIPNVKSSKTHRNYSHMYFPFVWGKKEKINL